MNMATVKYRQLIDMAIGSPEPGHVNFYALHCLLSCLAEKLNILDETIDYSKYEAMCLCTASAKTSNQELGKLFGYGTRIVGGSDTEGELNGSAPEYEAEPETQALPDELDEPTAIPAETLVELAPEVEPDAKLQNAVQEVAEHFGADERSAAADLSPITSVMSSKSVGSPSNMSVRNLDDRISKVEVTVQKLSTIDDFFIGVAVMKDQLELAMEQLLLITYLTLSKKPDTHRVHQLLGLSQTLRAMRKENVYIKGSSRFERPTIQSLDWRFSGLQLNEEISEDDILVTQPSCSKQFGETVTANRLNQHELEGCLCYSPDKMLDQLMELKGDFCALTNKINELTARLVKQERQQTLTLVQEMQEQIREFKLNIVNLKEIQDRVEIRLTNNTINIENIKKGLEDVIAEKVDKTDMEILLADKVDYNQLQRKVSHDQMLEVQCRTDKRFCEVCRQINENDKKVEMAVETLRQTLGFGAIEGILKSFKQQIKNEIGSLHDLLQKYVNSTNDECAAAGARIKVLQDLACLCCDTTCVMRTMEKAKVAKLPSAHASTSLSPLITYELGSIRKSGIMGYYRKDDFPHAPHAWMNQQGSGLSRKQIVPRRHAGGSHTTSSARERVEKVLLSGK